MSVRFARRLVVIYLVAYVCVLLYPGVLPFNRIRPFVLGMPFVLAWVSAWVVLGAVVFYLLEHATTRFEDSITARHPDEAVSDNALRTRPDE